MTIHNPSHNTQCERMVLATANNGEFQFSVNSWFDQLGIWILPHTISYNFCVPWISIPVSESDYIFFGSNYARVFLFGNFVYWAAAKLVSEIRYNQSSQVIKSSFEFGRLIIVCILLC